MFAPRLGEGDRVIYMTKKGSAAPGVRHLVAALEVIHRFETHKDGYAWYLGQGLSVPSNCLVRENSPLSIDHTDHAKDDVERWDLGYQLRVRRYGTFLACRPLAMEIHNPGAISDDQLISIFGRVPATRTPPAIERAEFEALLLLFW
jgi:hypothetical protein